MASPDQQAPLVEALTQLGVQFSLHSEDVVQLLEREEEALAAWRSARNHRNIPFEDYPRYSEVRKLLFSTLLPVIKNPQVDLALCFN